MVKLFVINNLIVYNGKTDKVIGTLQKTSNIFISFARLEIFDVCVCVCVCVFVCVSVCVMC